MSALTFAVVVGLIVAVVLLTQNGFKAAPSSALQADNSTIQPGKNETQPGKNETLAHNKETLADKNDTEAGKNDTQAGKNDTEPGKNDTQAGNDFLAKLKPLLSNKSLTALNMQDSPQSLSLQWLLKRSNFEHGLFIVKSSDMLCNDLLRHRWFVLVQWWWQLAD